MKTKKINKPWGYELLIEKNNKYMFKKLFIIQIFFNEKFYKVTKYLLTVILSLIFYLLLLLI